MQSINPVAFEIFNIPVMWYGILISAAVLSGFVLAMKRARKFGIDPDQVADYLIFALPAALVGLRVWYVAFNWHYYGENWTSVFALREGGLAIHGGIFAGILVAVIFTRRRGINFWSFGDLAAPSLILGQAIGRWGNYFNQEAYGVETDLPWAMYIAGAWRHPTFLYESLWNLAVFSFLIYLSKRERFPGMIFANYLIWYSAGRFFIEGLRTDSLMWGEIRVAQLISVLLIFTGVYLIYRLGKGSCKLRGGTSR